MYFKANFVLQKQTGEKVMYFIVSDFIHGTGDRREG